MPAIRDCRNRLAEPRTEIATATFNALADDQSGPRLRPTLDWYRIAFSNTGAITPDVRVGAARSALAVLTGVSEETRKLVRAYGRLLRTDKTVATTYDEVFWAKGPVQLTPDEWWLTRLSELRNAIVHGNEIPEALWHHDGHHQILQIHDRLLHVLRLVVAEHAHDPALRLPISERSFHRAARAAYQMLRAASE
jgi:hypothetical protein